jgi:hypothetical protein
MRPKRLKSELKSYIIANGKKAPKIHNLSDLLHIAVSIDESFSKIEDECSRLNQFTLVVRYDGSITITKADITTTNKCLSKIGNFPPIKSMRSSIIKKYNIVFSAQPENEKQPSGNKSISKKNEFKKK